MEAPTQQETENTCTPDTQNIETAAGAGGAPQALKSKRRRPEAQVKREAHRAAAASVMAVHGKREFPDEVPQAAHTASLKAGGEIMFNVTEKSRKLSEELTLDDSELALGWQRGTLSLMPEHKVDGWWLLDFDCDDTKVTGAQLGVQLLEDDYERVWHIDI